MEIKSQQSKSIVTIGRLAAAVIVLACTVVPGRSPRAAESVDLPPGFAKQTVASGLTGASGMAIAPDGRIFICEQTGTLRLVKDGKLLEEPVLSLAVDSFWERGLIGVALDPQFAQNGFVYVVYVAAKPYPHHRISRFTLTGDRIDRTTENCCWKATTSQKWGARSRPDIKGAGFTLARMANCTSLLASRPPARRRRSSIHCSASC
jgi:glucose/arabinose dehydrogenase